VGRKPKPRLAAPKDLFSAQVVTVRHQAGRGVEVRTQVVFGGPRRLVKQWRRRQLGERRSKPPLWHGGMARCAGWWHPGGAARGVCPGAALAIGGRSGSWSVFTTV
jgi:hypothetical protein